MLYRNPNYYGAADGNAQYHSKPNAPHETAGRRVDLDRGGDHEIDVWLFDAADDHWSLPGGFARVECFPDKPPKTVPPEPGGESVDVALLWSLVVSARKPDGFVEPLLDYIMEHWPALEPKIVSITSGP